MHDVIQSTWRCLRLTELRSLTKVNEMSSNYRYYCHSLQRMFYAWKHVMSDNLITQNTISELNKKNMDGFFAAQKELLSILEKTNRDWCESFRKETTITTDFFASIGASRTVPEAIAAYQEWMAHRVENFTEDTRKFTEDTLRFVNSYGGAFAASAEAGLTLQSASTPIQKAL
jgi:Phasin protein